MCTFERARSFPSPPAPQMLQVPDQWLLTSPVMGYQMDSISSINGMGGGYRDPETGQPVTEGRAQTKPADA